MTASTRTVTLSRVMPSWAGTGIVTICMFTLRSRSTPGTIMVNPGGRTSSWSRPSRSTTPRSYCLTTRAAAMAYTRPPASTATRATTNAWTITAPCLQGAFPHPPITPY